MPVPEAQRAIEGFRNRLNALDAGAAAQLVQAYGPIWERLEGDILGLMEQVQDRQMSFAQVSRLSRYQSLQEQVARELAEYASVANGSITTAQRASVTLAEQSARRVIDAALPLGIDTRLLTQIGIEWNALPTDAFSAFVGIAGNGAPLSNLLAPLGAEAQLGIAEGIAEGIALGRGPRETARIVRNRFGIPLSRSLTLSRTETLRAFRESTRLQYASNQNVVRGYRRHATKDSRTCMTCIALDGTFYELNEPLDEHPNGRCALVPETLTYRDLGLDVPDDDRQPETGQEWFRIQPEATQRQMMGRAKFDAWKKGQFDLEDMPKVTRDRIWGNTATTKTLQELVA